MSTCQRNGCRNKIRPQPSGPTPKYCSDACRQAAYRERRRAGRKPHGGTLRNWIRSPVGPAAGDEDQAADDPKTRDDEPDAAARAGASGDQETGLGDELALARLLLAPPRPRPPRAREIIIRPDQIRPPAGGQLARRAGLQPPDRYRSDGDVIEIYGVSLSAHTPPGGTSCQACHIRTGSTRCEPAVCRLRISDPQEFSLPPMFYACRWCAAQLHEIGRILEPPARLASRLTISGKTNNGQDQDRPLSPRKPLDPDGHQAYNPSDGL